VGEALGVCDSRGGAHYAGDLLGESAEPVLVGADAASGWGVFFPFGEERAVRVLDYGGCEVVLVGSGLRLDRIRYQEGCGAAQNRDRLSFHQLPLIGRSPRPFS